jgi:serine/threonine-protein kinase
LLGTPAYSSPEAISHGTFSSHSDQFSLAATLYEALSQSRAFPGDDAIRVASLITTTQAAPIAQRCGLDETVDIVLQRAMNKDPKARYASCAEFGHALSVALVGASQTLLQDRIYAGHAPIHAANERDVGARTLRIIAGAGTFGAIVMAAVLQLTRGCQHEALTPEPGELGSTEATVNARQSQPRKQPRPSATIRERSAPASASPNASAPRVHGPE